MAVIRLQIEVDPSKGTAQLTTMSKGLDDLDQKAKKTKKSLDDVGSSAGGFGASLSQAAREHIPGFGKALDIAGKAGAGLVGVLGLVLTAAAAVVGVMASGARSLIAYGGHITDLTLKSKLSAETAQAWEKAAQLSGKSLEDMSDAVVKLQKNIGEGSTVFARMGLNLAELRKMTPEDQFKAVGKAILELKDPTQQMAAATEAMGKGASGALAALRDGFLESAEAQKKWSLSSDLIGKADAMGDSLTKLGQSWDTFKRSIAAWIIESGLVEYLDKAAHFINVLARDMRGGGVSAGPEDKAVTGSGGASLVVSQDRGRFVSLGGPSGKVDAGSLVKPRSFISQAELDAIKKAQEERVAREEIINKGLEAGVKLMIEQRSVAANLAIEEDTRRKTLDAEILAAVQARAATLAYSGRLRQGDMLFGGSGLFTRHQDVIDQETKNAADGVNAAAAATKKAADETARWMGFLQGAALLAGSIGGKMGQAVNVIGNIGESFKGFAGMSGKEKFNTVASAVGQVGGLIGGKAGSVVSGAAGGAMMGMSVAGPWGAAIGAVAGGLISLFKTDPIQKAQKEIGKALGHGISRDMAKQIMDEAKATGLSLAQVAKNVEARAAAEQAATNIGILRGGVDVAKQGAEALLGLMDDLSPKAKAAGGALVYAVQQAMTANGLGYLATGALRENKSFQAAQGAVGATSQLISGMRTAGGIDAGVIGAGGAMADALRQQAIDAAIATGSSKPDAEKIGIATVAPILTEQLNASLASGQKLDSKTQELIDEAKRNGISIVADPILQQLKVQQDMLKALETIAGTGTGAGANTGQGSNRDHSTEGDHSSAGGFGSFRASSTHMSGLGSTSVSGEFVPKRVRGGAHFTVHDGEGVIVIPKEEMGHYYSSLRGYGSYIASRGDGEGGGHPGGGGGGGGGAGGGSGSGSGLPPASAAAASDAIDRLSQQLLNQTPNVTVNSHTTVAPKIDPSMSFQTSQQAVDHLVEGVDRAIRLERGPLAQTIRRLVGKDR